MEPKTPPQKFVDKSDVRLGIRTFEDLEEKKRTLRAEKMRSRIFGTEWTAEQEKELDDLYAAQKELLAKLP